MAKNVSTTVVAGGKGKAVASKPAKGKAVAKGGKGSKPASKGKREFAFRTPKTEGGGLQVGEFGKVRNSDLPASHKKWLVLSTLQSLKGPSSPAEIVAAGKDKFAGRDARHYCYHAEAGGLVKRVEGNDCKGVARFDITAAGRKAVASMASEGFNKPAK